MAKQYKRKRADRADSNQILIVPPPPQRAQKAVLPAAPVLAGQRVNTADYNRGLEATRSFYSNAVAWGNSLLEDNRGQYSMDDASVAQLFGISVTAWACAHYRAESESGIAPRVVDEQDAPVERDDNPLTWLMDNHALLMFRICMSMLVWGKFYCLKIRNRAGKPTRLKWLNPLDVSPDIDYERQTIRSFRIRGRDAMVMPQDMIYTLSFDPLNEFGSLSPFMVAMRQVVGDRELVRFAQKFFQDGTMLGGMLSYEGTLEDEEYKNVKADFEQFKGSQNAFKTFVAGGGLAKFSYTPMQSAPVDLAMPDLKNMLRLDTCSAFGVNPILIGVGDVKDPLSAQSTYLTVRMAFIDEHAVPRVTSIYQCMTEQWLDMDFRDWGELRIVPDLDAINSAGKATVERSTTAVGNAGRIWTLNESREYTGRPPIPFPAVQINPDYALSLYDKGVIKRNRVLRSVGMQPEANDPDGFVYEVDPRAKGGNANMFSAPPPPLPTDPNPPPPIGSGGSGGSGATSSAPIPQRALPDVLPDGTIEADVVTRPPIVSDPIITKAQLYELEAWQGKVRKKGIEAPFEVKHVSVPVASYVRSELAGKWNPGEVFREAKAAVRNGREPVPMGATIQDANDYWHDYDGLQHDLGTAWLEYMSAVSGGLGGAFDGILNGDQVDLDKLMADNHGALIDSWIGSKDLPGVLTKTIYAGLSAGDKALQKAISANPKKPRAAGPLGLDISWALDSTEAFDYTKSYAFNLIRRIDDTTKEAIREAQLQYTSGTISKEQLRDLLAKTLVPPGGSLTDAILARAKSIGDTESANAFNQGAAKRWTNAGVPQAKVYTVRDDRVCPLCRGLYGTIADISIGWKMPNGSYKLPPFHPGCRDFMRPVTNELSI